MIGAIANSNRGEILKDVSIVSARFELDRPSGTIHVQMCHLFSKGRSCTKCSILKNGSENLLNSKIRDSLLASCWSVDPDIEETKGFWKRKAFFERQ